MDKEPIIGEAEVLPEGVSKFEKKEFEGIQDRLASLIRSISNRPDMLVTTEMPPEVRRHMMAQGKDPDAEWFYEPRYDRRTRKLIGEYVHIPPRVIEKTENVALGSAAHEAGHVLVTRMGEFVPDEIMQELGFQSLLHSMEERPTDHVVRERYPGAGEWVDEMRRALAEEGHAGKSEEEIEKSLGYLPQFVQMQNLLVFEPHYAKEILAKYNPNVLAVYNQIREDVELVEMTLPEDHATKEQVLASAKERYQIFYNRIWPELQKLIEQDQEVERLRQMVSGSSKEDILDKLKDELRKELENIIEEGLRSIEGRTDGLKDESAIPLAMAMLTPELLRALKELYDELPEEKRKQFEERAKKALENMEDILIKENSGELMQSGDTHAAHQEGLDLQREEEERRGREEEEIRKKLAEVERMQAGMDGSKEVYEKNYQEVRVLEEELYQRLEEIFVPNVKRTMKLRSSGSRLNLPAIFKWEANKAAGISTDNKIFESVHLPEKQDYVFTLLNDLSGSMRGEKIEQDFKAKIVLAEVLNRLGIKNEILGFQDEIIDFKHFSEPLTDSVRRKMSGMLEEVYGTNPGGHNTAGYNDDGPCLAEASRSLGSESGKQKFLIVISDGQPYGRHSTALDLKRTIGEILTTTDQKLIALGLGQGTEHVATYYPTALPNINVHDLPKVLGDLLEDIICNPEKYAYDLKKVI